MSRERLIRRKFVQNNNFLKGLCHHTRQETEQRIAIFAQIAA